MYKTSVGFEVIFEIDYLNCRNDFCRSRVIRLLDHCFCNIFAEAVEQLVMQMQVVVKACGLSNRRHHSQFSFDACRDFFFHWLFFCPILIKLRLGSTTIPKRNQRCGVLRKIIIAINHNVSALLFGSSKYNRQSPIFLYYTSYIEKSQ